MLIQIRSSINSTCEDNIYIYEYHGWTLSLKGPKHDQVESGFVLHKSGPDGRRLGDWWKKFILFMIGADICHFVFLAKDEHTLKIIKRIKHMLSIGLKFFSVCSV
jgi:hypothetical protein